MGVKMKKLIPFLFFLVILSPLSNGISPLGINIENRSGFPIIMDSIDKVFLQEEQSLGLSDTTKLNNWHLTVIIHQPLIWLTKESSNMRIGWWCGESECPPGCYIYYFNQIHIPAPIRGISALGHEMKHHLLDMWNLPDNIDGERSK